MDHGKTLQGLTAWFPKDAVYLLVTGRVTGRQSTMIGFVEWILRQSVEMVWGCLKLLANDIRAIMPGRLKNDWKSPTYIIPANYPRMKWAIDGPLASSL